MCLIFWGTDLTSAMTHVKSNTNLLEGAYLEPILQLEKGKLELERTLSTLLK